MYHVQRDLVDEFHGDYTENHRSPGANTLEMFLWKDDTGVSNKVILWKESSPPFPSSRTPHQRKRTVCPVRTSWDQITVPKWEIITWQSLTRATVFTLEQTGHKHFLLAVFTAPNLVPALSLWGDKYLRLILGYSHCSWDSAYNSTSFEASETDIQNKVCPTRSRILLSKVIWKWNPYSPSTAGYNTLHQGKRNMDLLLVLLNNYSMILWHNVAVTFQWYYSNKNSNRICKKERV